MTNLQLKPGCSWAETYARCVSVAPEAFESGRIRNLLHGEWQRVGVPGHHVTMVLHRDLLALLLVWEIGKPWRLAVADVDRCLDGVRW